jgi:hypothetical protein
MEEQGLKVCPEEDDNKIFGPESGQVTGYWRILCIGRGGGGIHDCILTRCYWDDHVKTDEMGGASDVS